MLRTRIAALAATIPALLFGTSGIATAETSLAIPESSLVLSISSAQQATPTAERVTLNCRPAGGSHPRASLACGQLRSVHGDFASLNLHPDRPCILLYAPVTVTAAGTWNGEPVLYRETFGNTCVLTARTGAVFQF